MFHAGRTTSGRSADLQSDKPPSCALAGGRLVYRIGGAPQPIDDALALSAPPAYDSNYPDENITTSTTYDALGRVVKTINNGGLESHACYDALGRAIKSIQNPSVADPCPAYTASGEADEDIITQTIYDAKGDAIAVVRTSPSGGTNSTDQITRTYYDSLHRARYVVTNLFGQGVEVTTPPAYNAAYPDQNVRQEMRYDAAGRVFETVDNSGMVTRTSYDLLDRGVSVVVNYVSGGPSDNQTNLTTGTVYDKSGALIRQVDANSIVTAFEYDRLNRLTTVIENFDPPLQADSDTNVRTEYTYDSRGNRLTITNAKLQITNYSYDALDRLLTETDPLNNTTAHTYDKVSQQTALTDANLQITNYSYDGLRRLETIDYSDATPDVTFAYDAVGNRLSMTDGAGVTAWTYDAVYRALSIQQPGSAAVQYAYDKLSNRLALTYPDTKQVAYAFDGLNRPSAVTPVGGAGVWGDGSGPTAYTYTAFGAQESATLPNGVTTTYTYDDAHRLTNVKHQTTGATLAEYAYTLDKVGNRTAVTETLRQPGGGTANLPDSIFADGFESGNLSGWSSNANGSGRLSATTAAALAGTYGLQANFNATTTAIYVTDDQPAAEPRYRARFYFDPNSAVMANNAAHYIFYGYTGTSTVVLRVELGYTTASGYRLRLSARDNASAWTTGSWVNITDAPHVIELDWQSATNGSVNWWIDEAQQTALTGFDNSARRIDRARLGLVAGIDTTTTGAHYFDAFESRRQTYIGSGPTLPEAIFANDFESGNLSYWTSSTGAPTVSAAASLAPVGTQGMAVPLASATTARYVTDSTPTYESRYRARFYFDPNSITMANNSAHYLFYGDSGTTAALRVELGYTTANGYRLRVGMLNNSTTWTNSPVWVNITDAPHVIELDWQSSTTGSLNWWIDEAPQTALTNVDNSARRIDRVRFGAVAGVDATTNGTLYFDAFESRRSTYIGPMASPVTTTTINYVYDSLLLSARLFGSDSRTFGLNKWRGNCAFLVAQSGRTQPRKPAYNYC